MPDLISVSEFIAETTEDYNSPTTSSFTTRLHNCRNTVTQLEEVGLWRRPHRAPSSPPPRPPAGTSVLLSLDGCWRLGATPPLLQPTFPVLSD